jgi:hypothetical protein
MNPASSDPGITIIGLLGPGPDGECLAALGARLDAAAGAEWERVGAALRATDDGLLLLQSYRRRPRAPARSAGSPGPVRRRGLAPVGIGGRMSILPSCPS